MFWRFRGLGNGRDNINRTFDEAEKQHARWCLDTLRANKPDDEASLKYIFNNSPTLLSLPNEYKNYFAGDTVFNSYTEIKTNLNSFKKYYNDEELAWIDSWLKK